MSDKNGNVEVLRLPLWRACLDEMRETGFTYQSKWPVEFFEERLRVKRDTQEFAFAMVDLRKAIEEEDGYKLKSSENGRVWSIPTGYGHEGVAHTFDNKVRSYMVRSINIRSATLQNPRAALTITERATMEKNLETASKKLVLVSRAVSISRVLEKHQPKLLVKHSR
jgi:hypothetical protein